MNALNIPSMMGNGAFLGMGFHGLTWLILLLIIGSAVWFLARAAGRILINLRQ